jgi:anthranilate phosphoribosyltransferase
VLVNASAALVVSGKASTFVEGVRLAAESIDKGAAMAKLESMAAFTTAATA